MILYLVVKILDLVIQFLILVLNTLNLVSQILNLVFQFLQLVFQTLYLIIKNSQFSSQNFQFSSRNRLNVIRVNFFGFDPSRIYYCHAQASHIHDQKYISSHLLLRLTALILLVCSSVFSHSSKSIFSPANGCSTDLLPCSSFCLYSLINVFTYLNCTSLSSSTFNQPFLTSSYLDSSRNNFYLINEPLNLSRIKLLSKQS